MTVKKVFFPTLLLFVFYFGCQKEETQKESTPKQAYSLMSTPDCAKAKAHICNEGLSFVKIGDSIPAIQVNGFEIKNMRDTVISTEDYAIFAKLITLTDGSILLEGAPFEKETTTPGPDQSHVKSIRIMSPLFETPEKIKVGSTFGQLKAVYPDSLFEVQPGAEGLLELKMPQISSHINYMIRPIRPNTEEGPGEEVYDVSAIAAESKIESIALY